MWTVFVFRGVAVLCDGDGHIVTYAVSARGARLHALADRLNARAALPLVLPTAAGP